MCYGVICVYIFDLCICMYLRAYLCVHMYVYVDVYVDICVHLYVYMYQNILTTDLYLYLCFCV